MSSSSAGPDDTDADKTATAGDRRLAQRYDIALDLRWKVFRRQRVEEGTGTTLNLSMGGILFEADRQVPAGKVQLSISWPVLLDNRTPLQLVVTGQTVRASGRRTAIRMMQHQFRTAKHPAGKL
jgi:hypothetical protein